MQALATLLPREDPGRSPEETSPGAGGLTSFLPLILIFVVFWLFLIRPQTKKEKVRREMMKELKKHDKVVTTGGMYGTVTALDENEVTLEIARDVRVRFNRNAVQEILKPAGAGALKG